MGAGSIEWPSIISGINDGRLGDGNDEFRTPLANMMHLLDDFVLKIPRKDQNVIGFGESIASMGRIGMCMPGV